MMIGKNNMPHLLERVVTVSSQRRRLLRVLQATPAPLTPIVRSNQALALSVGGEARDISTSRVLLQAQKKNVDANEAILAQQMMDFIRLAEEEEGQQPSGDKKDVAKKETLPVNGVVMDVKNNLASISGLRNATIGSVVAIHSTEDAQSLCRGVVLFLEKKVAHVALFNDDKSHEAVGSVKIGMDVTLEASELEIPASLVRFTGRAVNPLGNEVPLIYQKEDGEQINQLEEEETSASDRLSIAWGSKKVPGLMQRGSLQEAFHTGILTIDCFKPLAFGHRFGVLGPRNSGKTRLTLDIITRHVKASLAAGEEPPHFVYVCIGKPPMRVQQVLQFLEQTDALPYVTIVSADDRDSLIMQYLAPFSGCAIAEYVMTHGKSRKAVVVYDDLATHTMVVENLVQTMKLPKISQLSLAAHAILMERSAQLKDPKLGDKSLTTFALADTPDSTGLLTEFKERMTSIVDDYIGLEAALALQRVYPPVDVLVPGTSIRGPPYQSATLWKFMNRLRTMINDSSLTKASVDMTKSLGLEVEPEDAEVLEFQELVKEFFTEKPLTALSEVEKEIGVFFLTIIQIPRVPSKFSIMEFLREVMLMLDKDLLRQLETHPKDKPWSADMEEALTGVLTELLDTKRKQQQAQQKKR